MIATAGRVLRQLRHDPRTVAMLCVVPALLLVLLRYVFDSAAAFSRLAPALLGIFPFLLMFLVTSIATLARADVRHAGAADDHAAAAHRPARRLRARVRRRRAGAGGDHARGRGRCSASTSPARPSGWSS